MTLLTPFSTVLASSVKRFFSPRILKRAAMTGPVSPERRALKLKDGSVISYRLEESEAGSGPPCLLLPGALGTAISDFAGQFGPEGINSKGKLSAVISWDPPGYGDSRPPHRTWPGVSSDEGPTFYHRDARSADSLMKTLDQFCLQSIEQYSLVGWSDGAITSLIMAALFPERVSKIVCFAGNAYYTKDEVDGLVGLKDVSKWSERMRKPMEEIYGKDTFPGLWGEFVDACQAIMVDRNGDICKDLLSKITCPTLIIHGQKDALVAEEHPKFLKDNISNSRLEVFPEGKHNLHKKYAKEFNKMVEEFLTS